MRRSLVKPSSVSISPVPATTLILYNTSTPSANQSIINIGEVATFSLRFSVPEGTTTGVSISINTSSTAAGVLDIQGVSSSAAAGITTTNLVIAILDTDGDGFNDTAMISVDSILNLVCYFTYVELKIFIQSISPATMEI